MQALHSIYVRPWCRACSASCAIFRHYHRNAEWPILFAITSVSLCHHSSESLHHSSFLGCNAGLTGRSKAQCKWFEKLGFSLHLHTRISLLTLYCKAMISALLCQQHLLPFINEVFSHCIIFIDNCIHELLKTTNGVMQCQTCLIQCIFPQLSLICQKR